MAASRAPGAAVGQSRPHFVSAIGSDPSCTTIPPPCGSAPRLFLPQGYIFVQILHGLRLLPNEMWLQSRLDYLSVQATLLAATAKTKSQNPSLWDRIKAHTTYLAAVKDFQ